MENQFVMKTTRQKHRRGYALIEVIVVLMISIGSIHIISRSISPSPLTIVDAQIFTMMMKAIHTNSSQPIYVNNRQMNTYHPTHAFSKSFTIKFDSFEVTFYIGRGYYAIKKRS